MAQLCHERGRAVTSAWHDSAMYVAYLYNGSLYIYGILYPT